MGCSTKRITDHGQRNNHPQEARKTPKRCAERPTTDAKNQQVPETASTGEIGNRKQKGMGMYVGETELRRFRVEVIPELVVIISTKSGRRSQWQTQH